MRFYIIAGEASGDLQGSKLVQALQALHADTHCRAWGGDLMAAAGASIDKHIRELAFMGIVDVLRNLLNIKRNFVQCKQNIQDFKPDAIILIDYSGFNLRMAAWAKQHGYRVGRSEHSSRQDSRKPFVNERNFVKKTKKILSRWGKNKVLI